MVEKIGQPLTNQGGSAGTSTSQSQGHNESTSNSEAQANSHTESQTESHSHGGSRGTSKGTNHSQSRSQSVSHTPYDEKEEYREISSVTLWNPQELQLMQQGKLMNLPTGIALIKNANDTPEYVKVPHVKPVTHTKRGSARRLAKAEALILAANAEYYAPLAAIEAEASAPNSNLWGTVKA